MGGGIRQTPVQLTFYFTPAARRGRPRNPHDRMPALPDRLSARCLFFAPNAATPWRLPPRGYPAAARHRPSADHTATAGRQHRLLRLLIRNGGSPQLPRLPVVAMAPCWEY